MRRLPKIIRTESKNIKKLEFPVEHLSVSSMSLFSSNPLMFRIRYINNDSIETAHNVSAVLGGAFHHAVDVYFKAEKDALAEGLREGIKYIEEYPEGFIKWSKNIPDRQALLEKFAFVYANRSPELNNGDHIIGTELKLEHNIDIEWRGERLTLPVKLKGYVDRLERDEEGRLVITDEKTCYSYSDPDKIDGKKILQAIQYYLLVYAEYGEEPYKLRFVETKYTNGKDGVKTKAYDIIFSENELFFDFYLRFYQDTVRALSGEQVFLPNIDALYNNEIGIIAYVHRLDIPEEKARQERLHRVNSITDVLKKKVASVRNMKALEGAIERSLVEYKNIDYSKMTNEEKITTKLMEHGIVLHFDSAIDGNSFLQYRFTPSIGVKMNSLSGYSADIEQALGISGVRVIAPILDTTLVGIEVPKKERVFVRLTDSIIGKREDGVPLGVNSAGDIIKLRLDDMPHMLVAGATGSGKSVFINAVTESIIKQYNPKLYLIDPKMVELSNFQDRAKMVGYSVEDAINILEEIVAQMEIRYEQMMKAKAKHHSQIDLDKIVCVVDEFADIILSHEDFSKDVKKKNRIRRIVNSTNNKIATDIAKGLGMRIDETAIEDTVESVVSIENLIVRIAQKGRAAGIHLIIATQRPDSKVITGLIKANFPTKVAFATASETNSRIILDEPGAEKLMGKGDGLVSSPLFSGLQRIQGFSLE